MATLCSASGRDGNGNEMAAGWQCAVTPSSQPAGSAHQAWPPTRSQNILMRILEIIHRKPGPDTRGHAPLIDDALRAEYDQRTIKKTIASIDEESRGISLCFEEDRASKRFEILSDSNSFRSFVGKVSLTHSRSLTLS